MMKRLALIVATFSVLAAGIVAPAASAQNLQQACQVDQNSDLCQDAQADTTGIGVIAVIRSVANMISILAGIAGVVMVLLGGFRYIRSSGEPSKLSEAQNTIIYAIIGLVVAAAGQIIVAFVLNRL